MTGTELVMGVTVLFALFLLYLEALRGRRTPTDDWLRGKKPSETQ